MSSNSFSHFPVEIWSRICNLLAAQDATHDLATLMRTSKTQYDLAAKSLYRQPILNECNIKGFLVGLDTKLKRRCVWRIPQVGRVDAISGRREPYPCTPDSRRRKRWLLGLIRRVNLYERPFNGDGKRSNQIARHHDVLDWVLHNITGTGDCSDPLLPKLRQVEYTGDVNVVVGRCHKLRSHRVRMEIRLNSVKPNSSERNGRISKSCSMIPSDDLNVWRVCIAVNLRYNADSLFDTGYRIVHEWLFELLQRRFISDLSIHASSFDLLRTPLRLRDPALRNARVAHPPTRVYVIRELMPPAKVSRLRRVVPFTQEQLFEAEVDRYIHSLRNIDFGKLAIYHAFAVHDTLPGKLSDRLRHTIFERMISQLRMTHHLPDMIGNPASAGVRRFEGK